MKHLNSQKGAAPVIVAILVALILAAAGFAAYKAIRANQPSKTSTASTSGQGTDSSPSPSPTPARQQLVITQYGVKFTVPANAPGLRYTYHQESSLPGGDILFDSNLCSGNNGALGILSRSQTQTTTVSADARHNGLVAKVGSYYYNFTYAQNSCSNDAYVGYQQNAQSASLVSALKQLHAR